MVQATDSAPEELRSAQINIKLTPSEKADVALVAAFDSAAESETLRDSTLASIRERAAAIRAMMPSEIEARDNAA